MWEALVQSQVRVLEKVPEKVPVWEASGQSQVRFNRAPKRFREALVQSQVRFNRALHQSLPDLLRNLRNLLRNLVEPDPAPAPVHTGAILG